MTVSTGIITTIAGTGTSSFSGDGGAATSATLYYPKGVILDTSGNILLQAMRCAIIGIIYRVSYRQCVHR